MRARNKNDCTRKISQGSEPSKLVKAQFTSVQFEHIRRRSKAEAEFSSGWYQYARKTPSLFAPPRLLEVSPTLPLQQRLHAQQEQTASSWFPREVKLRSHSLPCRQYNFLSFCRPIACAGTSIFISLSDAVAAVETSRTGSALSRMFGRSVYLSLASLRTLNPNNNIYTYNTG